MSKRRYNFEVTDPDALLAFCPTALTVTPKYQRNYAVIAKLIDAAALSGGKVPDIQMLNQANEPDENTGDDISEATE